MTAPRLTAPMLTSFRPIAAAARCGWLLVACVVGASCAPEQSPVGAITASIVFGPSTPPGMLRQSLRTAAVPDFVDRLQVLALDTEGSTLAETNLFASPEASQLQLFREGGTWSLDAVPAGANRRIVARAYWGMSTDPRLNGALVLQGAIDGIQVNAGQTTDAGELMLELGPMRIPEADFAVPGPATRPNVVAVAAGDRLDVSWDASEADDVAGYLIAMSTMTDAVPPTLTRGQSLQRGDMIEQYRIVDRILATAPRTLSIEPLVNGSPIAIVIYSYDADATGEPLNYGSPTLVFGTPLDIVAPGAPQMFTVRLVGDMNAEISFVAPGEDDAALSGEPERYELRTADTRELLEDPTTFVQQAGIAPPPVAAPGTTVRFVRPLADLDLPPTGPKFVGIRAIDRSANAGLPAIAELTLTSSLAPAITALQPAIALAGRELVIRGLGFSDQPGAIMLAGTESSTLTVTLNITAWSDTEILAQIPADATTGILTVMRPDAAAATAVLTIVAQAPTMFPSDDPPFAFAATNEGRVAALYRERGFTVEAAIERFIDFVPEDDPLAVVRPGRRSDRIIATQNQQRFVFAASNADGRLDIVTVASSTVVSPDPFRQTASVGTEPADSLSIAALPTEDIRVPVLLAFTLQGTLRTSNILDARTDPPNVFSSISSTVATFDAAAVGAAGDGSTLVAHRTVVGTEARLTLRRGAAGTPDALTEVPGLAPLAGPRIVVRAAPGLPARFIVAYEHVEADGRRVRIFDADQAQQTVGVAPFDILDLELQDFGWVTRGGDVFLAIAAVRVSGGAELYYTEVPLSAVTGPDVPDGAWPGTVLDVASAETRARLGCAFELGAVCAIAWMSDDAGTIFLRR